MATDDERREVARRLREFASDYGSGGARSMNSADANERLEKLAHDAAVELTGIDRDALLAVAETLEDCAGRGSDLTALGYSCLAKRIREALGVER